MNELKEGILVYDEINKIMDIRFSGDEYYGGLHCGNCFYIRIGDKWEVVRIEYDNGWYLIGINKNMKLNGLKVRI